jgi:tetrahydromethanopterin S-methyltransferase subunit A
MAGETEVWKVMEKVDELFENNPGPLEAFKPVSEVIEWTEADEIKMDFAQDPKGYFVITIRPGYSKDIVAEHRDNNGKIANIIKGKNASSIYNTIVKMGLVSRLEHAAYLGKELAKAELALNKNLDYVQDSDLEI